MDETQDVQDIYGVEDETESGGRPQETTLVKGTDTKPVSCESSAYYPPSTPSTPSYNEDTQYCSLPPDSSLHGGEVSTFLGPAELLVGGTEAFDHSDSVHTGITTVSNAQYSTDIESPAFPLKDEQEVQLMRHYIDHMCRWVRNFPPN